MADMPEIAIIMPVWRQAGLADEAIASVLAQQGGAPWHLIIVNDGCPERDTAAILEAWRSRAPSQISLLHQANAGLAAARNAGIEFALKRNNFQALFFLDADNRLHPSAMQLFSQLLEDHPDPAWFYPNFDMFGLDSPQSSGGGWSLSRMAVSNMCDAGSLVRRTVFDAGLRFDPALRSGYEDWDFWLGAARLGFAGQPVDETFFRYRKRGQSMLREAHQQGEAVAQQLQHKHKWLFASGALAQIYAREWPRFAFVLSDGSAAFGDWPDGPPLDAAGLAQAWAVAQADPFSSRLPRNWIFASPAALDYLQSINRLGSVLLEMEAALAEGQIGAVFLDPADHIALRPAMRYVDKGWESLASAAIVALPQAHLATSAEAPDLLEAMKWLTTKGVIAPLRVEAPAPPSAAMEAAELAIGLLGRLVESAYRHVGCADSRPWRRPAAIASPVSLPGAVARLNLGGLHLPGFRGEGPHIGFALPILRFGGVEKCVVALARALRDKGVQPHLFLYGDDPAQADDWLQAPFETVHQMTRGELRDWSGARYLGTADGRAPGAWLAGRLFGPMTAMDVVINAGCGPLNSAASNLRRFGVRMVSWEHLIEDTAFGRPNGTPYLALSNEAAYDLILTCSQALADWLAGQSVARDKLLCLPNGPGFPDQPAPRAERPAKAPLRVGFMGRLDYQKGADRFCEIADALRGPGFAFSLTGQQVLGDSTLSIPAHVSQYPLARTPAELSAAYARLDVLLMPSRAEGLPLALLEARRAGVVPVVSAVGAVTEAVQDGINGILLPPGDVVGAGIAALRRLADNPELLHHLASAPAPKDQWADNATHLLAKLAIDPLA